MSDLPRHVTDAIREQEEALTKWVRDQTGRDDLTVKFDITPILARPEQPDFWRPTGECQDC